MVDMQAIQKETKHLSVLFVEDDNRLQMQMLELVFIMCNLIIQAALS